MILYLTRHGQVIPKKYFESVDFPQGDMPLSPLGRNQASLLGERLLKLGFRGNIYSSPYRRTLETASLIADRTMSNIFPSAALREFINTDEEAATFTGMTIDKIKGEFKHIYKNSQLTYPWWSDEKDNIPMVCHRTKLFLDEIIQKNEDTLFVGHGATVYGVIYNIIHEFNLKLLPEGMELSDFLAQRNLNCNMSRFEIEDGKLISAQFFDTEHLPEDKLTSNSIKKERPNKIIF